MSVRDGGGGVYLLSMEGGSGEYLSVGSGRRIDGVAVVESRAVGIAVEGCGSVVVGEVGIVVSLDGLFLMDVDILDILLCSLEMAAVAVQVVLHSAVTLVQRGRADTEEEDNSAAESRR